MGFNLRNSVMLNNYYIIIDMIERDRYNNYMCIIVIDNFDVSSKFSI